MAATITFNSTSQNRLFFIIKSLTSYLLLLTSKRVAPRGGELFTMFNVQRSMFNVLVLSHAVVVAGLGEYLAGDLTRYAVLDGDSLDGGRISQCQLV